VVGRWSPVSELRSLLDQLATIDLSALDPDELADGELLDGMPVLQSGITSWVHC
jgi:hypothetical protein